MPRSRRKRTGRSPALPAVLVLLGLSGLLLSVLLVLWSGERRTGLMALSQDTLRTVDAALRTAGFPPESAEASIEQENYDGARPYLYVYRRFRTSRPVPEVRRTIERALATSSRPLRGVRVKTFAEDRSANSSLTLCRIGTPRHTFYKIEWVLESAPQPIPEEPPPSPPTPAPPPAEESLRPSVKPRLPSPRGRIAIIIDDLGSEPDHLTRRFLSFPEKLTFAAFPRSAAALRKAEEARRIGRFDVIIHQPMEAEGQRERGTPFMPGTVLVDMTGDEIHRTLDENLRSLPFCRGMNNHQGSLATADARVMDEVMRWARRRGVFFIDSFTSPDSAAYRKAAEHGVPWLKRDVFLDNEDDERYVQLQLNRLIQIALRNGSAVGIGHATREATITVLLANARRITDLGLEFVHAKDLLRRSPP